MASEDSRPDDLLEGAFLDLVEDLDRRLGELAIARGWLTAAQLEEGLRTPVPGPPGTFLTARGHLSAPQLEELRREFPLLKAAPFGIPSRTGEELPPEVRGALSDPDRVFDRYVLVEEIGRGAMGTVWRAWDRGLNRETALKILRDDSSPPLRARFLREVQTTAALRHPNLVTVYDAGEFKGRPYLSMELVSGRPFDVKGPLRGGVEILRKVAVGLEEAHRRGIVHRDLKPANIMVDAAGEPRVVDFGLAHLSDAKEGLTRTGAVLGTPAYMAPEQVEGRGAEIRPATDVYALGSILYEALTGRPPHSGDTSMELLRKTVEEEPAAPHRVNSRVPRELETICLKAIEKEPARRYPTAGAFAEDLARWLQGEPIAARPVSMATRIWRKGLRHRRVLLPAIAAAVAVAVAVGWALSSTRSREEEAARREKAKVEAGRRLEIARPAIESAARAFYRSDVTVAEARRGVEAARRMIEEAAALAPELPLAHYLLGRAWELEGREEAAEAAWSRAIELDPGFGPARFQRARLLVTRSFGPLLHRGGANAADPALSARMVEEAIRELERSMEAGSGFDDALEREVARAMLAVVRKEGGAARGICVEGIERFGRAEGAEGFHWLLGIVSPPAEQVAHYDAALSIRPKFPWALLCRAFIWQSAGEDQKVIDDCTAALEIRPEFPDALSARGNAHDRRGEYAEAEADFDRAIRIDPKTESYWFNRANARSKQGKLAEAIEDYTQALRLWPTHDAAFMFRGFSRRSFGDLDGALADFAEVLRVNPGWIDAHVHRAEVHLLRDRPSDAIEELRTALDAAPAGWNLRPRAEGLLQEARSRMKDF